MKPSLPLALIAPLLLIALLIPGCSQQSAPPSASHDSQPTVTAADSSPTGDLTVHVDQPGVKISPILYGLMTEEINHSYDGGLYAELIQNRAFKDNAQNPTHWSLLKTDGAEGAIALDDKDPVNTTALTASLRLDVISAAPNQRVGIANDGYWGIPVRPATTYTVSFYARCSDGFNGPLTADIESNDGSTTYASASVPVVTTTWQKYDLTLTTTPQVTPSANNRFVISASSKGAIWFTLVSLFPPTYNDRPNGNRIDLMQKLADMNPAFLRLPGGNYLEGNTIDDRFDWSKTTGPLDQRPGHRGPWGYRSSDGLGLLEFLDWCDDLHMQPLLAVYAGYSLRQQHVDPGPDLQPYVDDALNEIEYATGDTNSRFGRQRALDGHPLPFNIAYIEIGNEDQFDRSHSYDGRFAQFFDAIKAKYPTLKLIATMPVTSRTPDLVDDHYYRSARVMERDSTHYDHAPRNGPKIFVGEWASKEGAPTPTYNAALGDAAWLTGLERDSDLVLMASYAPLLVNVNRGGSEWSTNMIGYDALSSFGSPSYYVQKIFALNRGDTVLPVQITPPPVPPHVDPPPHGSIGVATWATTAEYKDLQVTSTDGATLYQSDFSAGLNAWRRSRGNWSVVDGSLRQSSNRTDCRATVGDPAWTDYTYTLSARKTAGNEGLLVMFHAQDSDNFLWWNIGGWDNTRTAIESTQDGQRTEISSSSDVTIVTGRWYNIRIEVAGRQIKCFLDDRLVSQATEPPTTPPAALYATASRIDSTGCVIIKVVNVSPAAQSMRINLAGIKTIVPGSSADVMTGRPTDQNTLANPLKVAPQRIDLPAAAPTFTHEFPAYSITVMRLDAR